MLNNFKWLWIVAVFSILSTQAYAVNCCCDDGSYIYCSPPLTCTKIIGGDCGGACTVIADCYAAPNNYLNSTNSTLAGTPIKFNLYWNQTQIYGVPTLSKAITELWNGSSWINSTSWCSLSGQNSWCNQTMTVNSTAQTLWWRQYANNSMTLWKTSSNFSLITTSGNTCTYSGSGDWFININDNCTLSSSNTVTGNVHVYGSNGFLNYQANQYAHAYFYNVSSLGAWYYNSYRWLY